MLVRNLERIKLAIMWQQKTFGIAMNERLFSQGAACNQKEGNRPIPVSVFTPNELDLLYSEFVLLDI